MLSLLCCGRSIPWASSILLEAIADCTPLDKRSAVADPVFEDFPETKAKNLESKLLDGQTRR